MFYKNLDLSSDVIDTLLLGSGGTRGFFYLGIIKYLEKIDEMKNIKNYYGVSAGSIISLLLNLGYTSVELESIISEELNYADLIKINSKSVLNIFDKFSLADTTYLENTIKSLIERKGFNPYINFKQLYDITNKELNVSFIRCLQNEFVLANHKTRPEMPVWLAVRASSSIPIMFQPVIDCINGFDFLIDGAIANDNLIGLYLTEKYNEFINNSNSILSIKNSIGIQVPDIVDKNNNDNEADYNINNDNNTDYDIDNVNENDSNNKDVKMNYKKKYHFNFISSSLKSSNTKNLFESLLELNKVKFQDYLISIVRKLFNNQDSNKDEFLPFIFKINENDYNIDSLNTNIPKEQFKTIINDILDKFKIYFETNVRIKN
jgi:hypothetical protein